jgi:hypothetical protein
VSRHTPAPVIHDAINDSYHYEVWRAYRPRSRRPTPPALIVAWCVFAAVLVAVLVGLPPLLRVIGAALA